MKDFFDQEIQPLADELEAMLETPFVLKLDQNQEPINLTQCDTCQKAIHPQQAIWGMNDQPYCNMSCAFLMGQTVANDTYYLVSPEDK